MTREITYNKNSWTNQKVTESIESALERKLNRAEDHSTGALENLEHRQDVLMKIVARMLNEMSDEKVITILEPSEY